jgi:hypothetical protein
MSGMRSIAWAGRHRAASAAVWVRALRPAVVALVASLLLLSGQTTVGAQATRTWVSGVGDDANPCSRTAPCKTFPGAISKTAARGEINVLDPGGFGGVTITKAITIAAEGVEAGVLVSGTNAIIINTTNPADVVVLRGLDIEGLGSGLSGVKQLSAGILHIENSTINGFATNGVEVALSGANTLTELYIKDTNIRNNNFGASTAGVKMSATNGVIRAVLDNVNLENNTIGLEANDRTRVMMRDSVSAGNTGAGVRAVAGAGAEIDLVRVTVTGNVNGVVASGGGSIIRLGGVVVTGNNTGLVAQASGAILSPGAGPNGPGMNIIFANGADGSVTGNLPTQ